MTTTTQTPKSVTQHGAFYVTTVDGVEYKTNQSRRGLWCEDCQVEGTMQVSFRTLAAFRTACLKRQRSGFEAF